MYLTVLLAFMVILFMWTRGNISLASVIEATLDSSVKSWNDASLSGSCQLAGGQLSSGMALESLTFNVTNTVLPTTEVWLGATVSYSVWLELQSCNFGKEIDTTYRYDISSSTDPAEACLDKCGNTTFYLTDLWCYCTLGVTYSEISGCNVKFCQGDRPCGNEVQIFSTFTYYCMCSYSPVAVTEDNRIGGCKKVVHDVEGSVQTVTTECEEENPVLCINLESGNRYIPGGISNSWAVSASVCNAEGAIIAGREGANVPFNGNFVHWIGVFRIAHVTWKTTHSGIPSYCLSAIIGLNGTASQFVRTCTSQLPSLCETPTVDTTATQGVSQEQTTSDATISSSTEVTTMETNMPEQNSTVVGAVSPQSTDRTGLIVGIVLAVIFALALAVLTQYLITKRRRKRKEMEEKNRLGSLKKLPHSLRKAGEENKLSIIEPGNDAHLYNDLNELQHSKSAPSDMYDHVQTGRSSMNLYSELQRDGHRQKETEINTYDTMASINAEREAGEERAQAVIPSSDTNNTYNSLGEV